MKKFWEWMDTLDVKEKGLQCTEGCGIIDLNNCESSYTYIPKQMLIGYMMQYLLEVHNHSCFRILKNDILFVYDLLEALIEDYDNEA